MKEVPLSGGRITEGVVRVGDTVRRRPTASSRFVRSLLQELERAGFEAAPRHLGSDELGREVFSFLEGEVPHELDADFSDETLAAAARLIRRYHDATAGSPLARPEEVVCHNDLSPCNFVFREGTAVGLVDFDAAAPGARLADLGYAIFLWLNLGTDGPEPRRQARRIAVFCDAYGIEADGRVLRAIVDAVARNVESLDTSGRSADVAWWRVQLEWLERNEAELLSASDPLTRGGA
jgi:hypothetical protein